MKQDRMNFVGLLRKLVVERRSDTARAILAIVHEHDTSARCVESRIAVARNVAIDYADASEDRRHNFRLKHAAATLSLTQDTAERMLRFVARAQEVHPSLPHIVNTSEAGGWKPIQCGGHVRHMAQGATQ